MSGDDDLRRRLELAIASLDGTTRAVFLLHRVDELSYERIAHRLGIGLDDVEHHLAEALLHLYRELGTPDKASD